MTTEPVTVFTQLNICKCNIQNLSYFSVVLSSCLYLFSFQAVLCSLSQSLFFQSVPTIVLHSLTQLNISVHFKYQMFLQGKLHFTALFRHLPIIDILLFCPDIFLLQIFYYVQLNVKLSFVSLVADLFVCVAVMCTYLESYCYVFNCLQKC